MELQDERTLMFSSMRQPPFFYLAMPTKEEFFVHDTKVTGKYDMDMYRLKYLKEYIWEICACDYRGLAPGDFLRPHGHYKNVFFTRKMSCLP